MTNFTVLHKKDVLLEVEAPKEIKSQSGIVLDLNPSVVHDRQTQGKVIQVGEKVTDIKEGDIVIFPKTAGVDISVDDEKKIMLISYKNILGKLK